MEFSEVKDYLHYEGDDLDKAMKILSFLFTKYEYAGIGLYRIVFKMKGDRVIKFPICASGEYCNDGEGSWFGEELAKGRIHFIQGITCLVQEYVREASYKEIENVFGEVPDWVASIDGGQVGFTKTGELKAYDFIHP